MERCLIRPHALLLIALIAAAAFSPQALGQILLRDDFDDQNGPTGAQNDGVVDKSTYRAPFGGEDFLGRTQLRFVLPAENVSTLAPGSTDGKVAVLNLDTYNPLAPGAAFFGTDLLTKANFARAGGLRWEGRMRFRDGVAAGLVGAGFLYDVQRQSPPNSGTLVRDEIDHELLSNVAVGPNPDSTFTNVWNDGAFTGPTAGGAGATINTAPISASFDLTAFHNYRIDWLPNRVEYYIDNTLVRTETSVVPDDPMKSHFNLWAPASDFSAAYNASLQPTAVQANNQTYSLEIDYVQIERLNTTATEKLFDGGFENTFELSSVSGNGPPPTINSANGTGEWIAFNNAYIDFGEAVAPANGFNALKTYGPFKPNFDASGVWQNVAAAPGQEFHASVLANSPSADSIATNGDAQVRFTTLNLSFHDAAGAVIKEFAGNPDSANANGKETPIFDSRDANLPSIQDSWIQYTVDAIAPAGTAFVRYNLFFVQDGNFGGGAVYFDDASLLLLTPDTPAGVVGDYNNDGFVNAADYTVWRDALGAATALPNDPIGGTIGQSQYTQWKSAFGNSALGASVGASSAVPEPSAIALLGCVALAAGLRRRP
ncbi:Glycosyl hydrolases family 16 [Pirellulimonas nuda]|uniref:Glycosyl hydrolases family 16 n=1 Tax=Pirellulimonas nuda TaxID=2528009 RepID=A0A518D909_9BACT|nr:family 16 glycosylhydrolase [Pirellulimonas nuda]QDU87966.1 Glycosyl hydrolases family 16 [Pirellulimonas nuda]